MKKYSLEVMKTIYIPKEKALELMPKYFSNFKRLPNKWCEYLYIPAIGQGACLVLSRTKGYTNVFTLDFLANDKAVA